MRHVLWIAALAASLGAGSAAAQTPAPAGAQVRADAVQADAGAKADADAAAGASNPTCLKHTGSRVPVRGKRDCAGHGRSYDRKELERTGQADVGQALRSLDPRLR